MNKEPDRNPRKALGRGLSALLPARGSATQPSSAGPLKEAIAAAPLAESKLELADDQARLSLLTIPLNRIVPNKNQPRVVFDAASLDELAQSIRANGLIQPITVFAVEDGKFMIIAGERRWRAAHFAGLKDIPAYVRPIEPNKLLELALIENLQREDLNPVETANAFHRLTTEHRLSHEQIAERTGKDRSTISNFLRLLKLGPIVLDELGRGTVSVGHARALLALNTESEQTVVCDEIISRQLSVRETEALVKKRLQPGSPSEPKESTKARPDPNVRAAIEEMTLALGTKVRLFPKPNGGGTIEIDYFSQDDLDRIYAIIVREN